MKRKLTVLLVEDEPLECRAISQYTDTVDDVSLVGVTNSASKAIEYVSDCLPDAIILDVELHKGSGNGVIFLTELRKLNLAIFPYILVTTANTSQSTYEKVRELGADFIMVKYQDDYSAENVIEFLRSMKNVIQQKSAKQGLCDELITNEPPEKVLKRISKRINTELELIGISPKMIGKKYLADAILKTINRPMPNISSEMAKKYGKSDASINRAMQNAINVTWRNSNIDDLSKHYTAPIRSEKGVPTVTELIYYYAEKIKQDI